MIFLSAPVSLRDSSEVLNLLKGLHALELALLELGIRLLENGFAMLMSFLVEE